MADYDNSAKSYLAQNLNVIMSVWKIDQQEFSELIGLNYPTFNNYMALKTFPRVPTLLVISDVTGISIDLLLRQIIPIHLIPEKPINRSENDVSMVREEMPLYKSLSPPLLDYSVLQKRLEHLEYEIREVVSRLDSIAGNCQT